FPTDLRTLMRPTGPAQYECAMVHMNPRSQAGTVELRSADPRDVPAINLNFFKDGAEEDLQAIYEGAEWYAVLDSKFRVRGTRGLRVVDASSFPKVPGGFPVLPTMMISEKATEDVLADT
ncbi:unnamed protein product, partial [Alternaria alternata]